MDGYDARCKIYDIQLELSTIPQGLKNAMQRYKELQAKQDKLFKDLATTHDAELKKHITQLIIDHATILDTFIKANPRVKSTLAKRKQHRALVKELGYTPHFIPDDERPIKIERVNGNTRHKTAHQYEHEYVKEYDAEDAPRMSDYPNGLEYQWAKDAYENQRLNKLTVKYAKMSNVPTPSYIPDRIMTYEESMAIIDELIAMQREKELRK